MTNVSHDSHSPVTTQDADVEDMAPPPSPKKSSSRKRPASSELSVQHVQERSRVLRDRLNTRSSRV